MRYTHGGDVYGHPGILDFSANISPLGLPNSAKRALMDTIPQWGRYPDPYCRDLTHALCEREGVPERWVAFGAGAAELIFRAAHLLRPAQALVMAPTFCEYEAALAAEGCRVRHYLLTRQNGFRMDEGILECLTADLDFVALCNPNNPTGEVIGRELLQSILERCKKNDIWLLVDECFLPFLDDPDTCSGIGFLKAYPQLLLLRAFTKTYAMAGLRLGYLLCADERFIERAKASAPPWNISTPAQVAGVAALRDTDYLTQARDAVREERAWMRSELEKLGLEVFGSRANYLFFCCEQPAHLEQALEQAGILIRACGDYVGLDGRFYRAAVRLREENCQLVQAIKTVLKGG